MILAFAFALGAVLAVLGLLAVVAETGGGRHVRPGDTPHAPHARPLHHHARTA